MSPVRDGWLSAWNPIFPLFCFHSFFLLYSMFVIFTPLIIIFIKYVIKCHILIRILLPSHLKGLYLISNWYHYYYWLYDTAFYMINNRKILNFKVEKIVPYRWHRPLVHSRLCLGNLSSIPEDIPGKKKIKFWVCQKIRVGKLFWFYTMNIGGRREGGDTKFFFLDNRFQFWSDPRDSGGRPEVPSQKNRKSKNGSGQMNFDLF